MSNKQHGILLGIATGIALEKVIGFFCAATFLLENAICQNYVSLLEKSDFSDALDFFLVDGEQ